METSLWSNTWQRVDYFDWLVQERRNSSALAKELRLSCTNPLISMNNPRHCENIRLIILCNLYMSVLVTHMLAIMSVHEHQLVIFTGITSKIILTHLQNTWTLKCAKCHWWRANVCATPLMLSVSQISQYRYRKQISYREYWTPNWYFFFILSGHLHSPLRKPANDAYSISMTAY